MPYRFPEPELAQPDDFSTRLNEWKAIANKIKDTAGLASPESERIHVKADLLLSEIAATEGNFRLAESTLKSIGGRYSHLSYEAAKATAYLVRIQSARDRLNDATTALIDLATRFPGEKTTLGAAAIDLMDSIKPDDPNAISKLTTILNRCKESGALRGYTRRRIGEILAATDKSEAASGEFRLLLKDPNAPAHIYHHRLPIERKAEA